MDELALRLGLTRQWTSGLLQGLIAAGSVRRSGRWLLVDAAGPSTLLTGVPASAGDRAEPPRPFVRLLTEVDFA